MTRSRDYVGDPRPRPMSRRGWVSLAIALVVVTVLYVLAAISYNAEGGSRTIGAGLRVDTTGLVAVVEPRAVDAAQRTAMVHVDLGWSAAELVDAEGDLLQNVRVTAVTSLGATVMRFGKGEPLGQFEVTIGLDGEDADYPFDRHSGELVLLADVYEVQPDGSSLSVRELGVDVVAHGGVNGWDSVMELPSADGDFMTFSFTRAFSTQVFAILLVVIAVLISVSALLVSLLVVTNRRVVEATMLSWFAALLFALPALRGYLPNAPPVGATLDIFVYLWAIVMAGAALLLMVVAWSRQKRAGLLAQRRPTRPDPEAQSGPTPTP